MEKEGGLRFWEEINHDSNFPSLNVGLRWSTSSIVFVKAVVYSEKFVRFRQ